MGKCSNALILKSLIRQPCSRECIQESLEVTMNCIQVLVQMATAWQSESDCRAFPPFHVDPLAPEALAELTYSLFDKFRLGSADPTMSVKPNDFSILGGSM